MKKIVCFLLIIILSLNFCVNAQVKYVDIVPDVVLASPASGSINYTLDLDSNYVTDYKFDACWASFQCAPGYYLNYKAIFLHAYEGSLFSDCNFNSEGDIIDSISMGLLLEYQLLMSFNCANYTGCFAQQAAGKEYISIKFKKDNKFYYGWIKVSCTYGEITIKSYAYNTVAGQPILASESIAGSVSGGSSICEGNSTGTLTLVNYVGNINKWQKRVDSGNWIDISNNSNTYAEIPSSAGTWQYRAEVQNGTYPAYSAATTVIVNFVPSTPTVTQSVKVLTSSATNGNQWYLNNNIIPGATSQTYTCTETGNYTVVVTVNNCSSAPSLPIYVNVGLSEEKNRYGFYIIPNPIEETFTINYNLPDKSSQVRFELYATNGKMVYSGTLKAYENMFKVVAAKLENGVYIANLLIDGINVCSQKIVKD